MNNPSGDIRIGESAITTVPQALKPRKIPSQARSGATVEAVYEATIQVLLTDGLARLTTTRVAARAGVSVGTLYQYFPNKHALLFAILLRYFEELAEAVEQICNDSCPRPLVSLAENLADAYMTIKLARPEVTMALYRVAGVIEQNKLSTGFEKRLQTAVVRVLKKASDASFHDVEAVAFTLLSALAGMSRATFEIDAPGDSAHSRLREQARVMSRAYLQAASSLCA